MSEKFDSNLIINIKVSYLVTGVLLLIHFGGALLIGLVPLSWLFKILLWAALAASLIVAWQRHISRTSAHAITALELDREGICAVRRGPAGPWRTCERFQAVVHPWTVIFLLREQGQRWPAGLVMAADAVEPAPFRRLRARLRLQTPAA